MWTECESSKKIIDRAFTFLVSSNVQIHKQQMDLKRKNLRNPQCCGFGMLIPDPRSEFFHPGSRIGIRIKEFKYI
jgi:hypothetical protein